MNKKGKNKKGKVPNPVPTQEEKNSEKVEDSGKIGAKIEDVGVVVGDITEEVGIIGDITPNLEEKIESIKEKRVPEIVSEVITPTIEANDEETPKKPKRNRGKKKKGRDDDFDENLEENPKEIEIQSPVEETKVDIPETESKIEEVAPITPTARKKKNKKKNADQKTEELITSDQKIENISKETEKKPEVKELVPELKQEFLEVEVTEQEVKPSKKKNKKKKRNDSEKSDKEEFSCTTAFQKLLDDKNESEIKMEEKIEDLAIPIESVKIEKTKAEIKSDKIEEITLIQPAIEKAATPVKVIEEIKEPILEGKSKKKNKKDKKQMHNIEDTPKLDEPKANLFSTLIDFTTPAQNIITEAVKEVITATQEEKSKEIPVTEILEPQLLEKLSPKPKAKIAKPVEKKRKGKQEAQNIESAPQDITESLKPEDLPQGKLEKSETVIEGLEKVSDIVPQSTELGATDDITFMTPDEDEKLIAQEFELLAEKAMGKKRKKGSKMPKPLDISTGIQEKNVDPVIKPSEMKEETTKEQLAVITEVLTPQISQQEFVIMSEKTDTPTAIDTLKETPKEEKLIEQQEFHGKELLTPEIIGEEKEFAKSEEVAVSPQTEDKHKTETKSGKKRKKSPKPPKKTEIAAKTEERPVTPKPAEVTTETSKSEELTHQSLGEKIDASNITRMYDIEISSIKADESEGSACDVIPDVTYPRASSQQSRDDNNNTVIREIFPPVQLISDVPIIQECTAPKKQEATLETSPKDEKTDIKSKMMEVNQDMEELRLSIERSLAELTSMEKSEESIEKEFEATRTKAKNVSSLLFDTSERAAMQTSSAIEKETAKSTEHVAISKPLDVTEMKNVVEGNIAPKLEEMPKSITKEKTPTRDKSKIPPLDEKVIQSTLLESKMTELPFVIDDKPMETSIKTEDTLTTIPPTNVIQSDNQALIEEQKLIESLLSPIPLPPAVETKTELKDNEKKDVETKPTEQKTEAPSEVPPVCPARKDNKGKNKKKKGKQDTQMTSTATTQSATTQSQTQETKKEEKSGSKTESKTDGKSKSQSTEKGKQQASSSDTAQQGEEPSMDFEPIENFEDALTSSIDDVNKTFEMIVKESQEQNNPKINIIAPDEEKTPVSPPKNLLGHPDIPVRSNRRDFKKEKDKIPNEITARVKIKDSVEVERKQSKNTQTNNKIKEFTKDYKMDGNDDFVYKYSFRKVFLQSCCHVCKKCLSGCRVACSYCNLLFYCSNKHKDEDWPQHQALCFAVSTLVHLKDQKHIYGDAKNLTGHDYRLIRMQMIVSCEKVLKRRLVPWEQEALLYPRVCAHVPCREWRQNKLSDCQSCGQISFCTDNPDHFPKSHSRWCKSYSLYEKLVSYQQTKGRLEPKMPTKVLKEPQQIPEKINEVLASMYEEKIDINDIQYAALTQLATAPLTAAYCHQLCKDKVPAAANGINKKLSFTIHVVGAELQFEADALNKWEVFFLHLRPDLQELRVVLINYNLNPSNLPLELLGKIKLCEDCRQNKRRVLFSFQDKRTYVDYKSSEEFVMPDIVCAFNPSIQRSSVYNGKDPWPSNINAILKLKVPFIITGYTITELHKDCIRIKECSETGYNFIAEPKYNNFASVRPDRNFISDDEMPLLFKNYCYAIISA